MSLFYTGSPVQFIEKRAFLFYFLFYKVNPYTPGHVRDVTVKIIDLPGNVQYTYVVYGHVLVGVYEDQRQRNSLKGG